MSKKSFKDIWKKQIDASRSDLEELTTWDIFEDWERHRGPESKAENQFINALDILFAGTDDVLAHKFLERCLAILDRAFKENKFESKLCAARFPLNRGGGERLRAYAQALLGGKFSPSALITTSEDCEEHCNLYPPGHWDAQSQAYYLAAIRAALIAGDVDRAARLLKTKKSFKWHATEHGLLQRVATAAPQKQPIRDPKLFDDYDNFFDQIRDPASKPNVFTELHILRFELGVIRFKYFMSKSGEIDWPTVIESISS